MLRQALELTERESGTVAECIESVLVANGISLMATIPGGPLMPMLKAIHDRGRIRAVLTRHESGAAMLAEGYARVRGEPALVAVTAGPGLSNAATGIALAHREQTPLVVLSAQVPNAWNGRDAAQELDGVRLLEPITKISLTLSCPERAQSVLEHLVRVARSGRPGPVHLSVPANLWSRSSNYEPPRPLQLIAAGTGIGAHQAAELVRLFEQAQRPCVLAGRGVLMAHAEEALLELARRCPQLRVACTPRSKGAFPEGHPQSLGVFGFAGHENAERALLDESDVLFILGSRLGEITSLNWDERFKRPTLVQVDICESEIGKNFPVALGIVGRLDQVIEATVAQLPPRPATTTRRAAMVRQAPVSATQGDGRVHPKHVMQVLNATLSGEEHVFVDIGNTMAWAIHHLERRHPGRWHVNLMYGCMGHALPAALGGAIAAKQPVVALMGDAAFAMSGVELHTAAEQNLPVIALVLNDSGHGMVEFGATHQWGANEVLNVRFGHAIDAAALARSLGLDAFVIRDSVQLARVLESALAAGRPALLDVQIDPTAIPPFGSRMTALEQNFCPDPGEAAT